MLGEWEYDWVDKTAGGQALTFLQWWMRDKKTLVKTANDALATKDCALASKVLQAEAKRPPALKHFKSSSTKTTDSSTYPQPNPTMDEKM